MTEHVIWVVMNVGQHAATAVCWRHDEDDAKAVAEQLSKIDDGPYRYHFAIPVSDVPPRLKECQHMIVEKDEPEQRRGGDFIRERCRGCGMWGWTWPISSVPGAWSPGTWNPADKISGGAP